MTRFELSIDPNYVPHWTVLDAVREIFQNALDESSTSPENSMDIIRDGTDLKICTKNAKLTKSTLLIGNSSKRDDATTIGKEGEGYKLASLVLVRSGHPVTIQNFSAKEVWTPKIINSRRYDSKFLVFDTKRWLIKSTPDHDLTFIIGGITDEIYAQLQEKILHLRDKILVTIQTDKGSILTEESEVGNVYVNGLFVTKAMGFKYGYNLKPECIKLDRDRREVNDFELSWTTSTIWGECRDKDLLNGLVEKQYKDVEHIGSIGGNAEVKEEMSDDFYDRNGDTAYPVTTNDEMDHVKTLYSDVKPIIVTKALAAMIGGTDRQHKAITGLSTRTDHDLTPKQWLLAFKEKIQRNISSQKMEMLDQMIELSANWKNN